MSVFELLDLGLLDGTASGGDWSDTVAGVPMWGEVL